MNILGENRGFMGIGALIILIAILLIAAIATTLLIAYGAKLQQSAIKTSHETEGSSNGVNVISIIGTDGSTGKDIEHFEVVMKLALGSEDMRMNDTLIILDTPGATQSLLYNMSAGHTSDNAATTSDYTVEWIKQGEYYKEGYLSSGDIIKARFNHNNVGPTDTTGGVAEERDVEIRIIPRFGVVTAIPFVTPKHVGEQREPLYPKEGLI